MSCCSFATKVECVFFSFHSVCALCDAIKRDFYATITKSNANINIMKFTHDKKENAFIYILTRIPNKKNTKMERKKKHIFVVHVLSLFFCPQCRNNRCSTYIRYSSRTQYVVLENFPSCDCILYVLRIRSVFSSLSDAANWYRNENKMRMPRIPDQETHPLYLWVSVSVSVWQK